MTIFEKFVRVVNMLGVGADVATNDQIHERFTDEIANAIIEERRIACWHVGLPFGAMLGSLITIVIGFAIKVV